MITGQAHECTPTIFIRFLPTYCELVLIYLPQDDTTGRKELVELQQFNRLCKILRLGSRMTFPSTPKRSTALISSSTPHTQETDQKTDQNSSKRLVSSDDHALERKLQKVLFFDYPLQSFTKSFLRQSLELVDTENMEDINWEEEAFFEKISSVYNGILSIPHHGPQSCRRRFFFQRTQTLTESDPESFKPDAGICSLSENKESLGLNNVNWLDVCLVCEYTRSPVIKVCFLRKL